jgi:hypothetical protein
MDYYIQVGEDRHELTEAEARCLLEQAKKPKRTLAEAAVGEVVRIGAREFLVLEQQDGRTAVILKDLLKEDVIFGGNNCYRGSKAAEICDQFADEMEAVVGAENLFAFDVDLTAEDGLKDYGSVECRAALLTADQYRKWVEVLDTCRLKKWWWLATPCSTKRHENDRWVKCVAPSGLIGNDRYDCGNFGVRPFCIFKSSIFVS